MIVTFGTPAPGTVCNYCPFTLAHFAVVRVVQLYSGKAAENPANIPPSVYEMCARCYWDWEQDWLREASTVPQEVLPAPLPAVQIETQPAYSAWGAILRGHAL